jgi:hypothetical protein
MSDFAETHPFSIMPDSNRKSEGDEIDATKLLEIELMQKRAEWKRARERRGGLRALSFFFLFAVIVAAIVAFYLFFNPGRVRELKSRDGGIVEPTPAVSGTP